jgi:mRNA-degrading endonuclease RelE of RelBE toxin-antitoxin system
VPDALDPSDAYALTLTSAAQRALAHDLPTAVAFAAWEFIAGPLIENPQRVGAPLRAPFEGYYRARRGEYRVRYRIDEAARTIIVVSVRHRRDAYRS